MKQVTLILSMLVLLVQAKNFDDYYHDAKKAIKSGEFLRSERIIQEFIKRDQSPEENSKIRLLLLETYLKQKSYTVFDSELKFYVRSYYEYPGIARAYYFSGIKEAQQKHFAKAIVEFDKSLDTMGDKQGKSRKSVINRI